MAQMTPELGARNLLVNCARATDGDRLLIAFEPSKYGYYDDRTVEVVAEAASALGLHVDTVNVGFNASNPHLAPDLLLRFEAADIILFLARLGDQLRFSGMPAGKTIVVSFAVAEKLLGSGFGNADHRGFEAIKSAVNGMFKAGAEVHFTCPLGTEVRGTMSAPLATEVDTTILRFPMSMFTPVPAATFSGRAAFTFLTGSGSRYYDNYTVEFDGPVFALLQDGVLTGFDGADGDVAKANAHYDRVAAHFGIDRNFVHSWHAGIHPGCDYPWPMQDNYERWGGVSFGNPRILHFHSCGAYAPGEISWNIIDPTVTINGVNIWENGTLHADRILGGSEILAAYPDVAELFANPVRNIGIGD